MHDQREGPSRYLGLLNEAPFLEGATVGGIIKDGGVGRYKGQIKKKKDGRERKRETAFPRYDQARWNWKER